MRRNRVLLAAVSAGVMAVAAGCGTSWRQARFERDVELTILHPAGSGVGATTANGAVRLTEAARDDVLVRARIRATTQERADAVAIVGEDEGGWLEVRAVWPEVRKGSEGVSFEIDAPGGRMVRAETGNGAVTITGFAGGAEVETSNGAVRVESHDGPVDARTSNGRVTILAAAGPVRADTSNGAVRVELTDTANGPLDIDTSNGAVTLIVGPGFTGRIDADTSNGSVRASGARIVSASGSKTHKVVQVGEGGEDSTIETSNGSVEIEVRQ